MITQSKRKLLFNDICSKQIPETEYKKLIEECAELIVAMSHYIEGRTGAHEEVIEELGDVRLMLDSMNFYFPEDKIMDSYDSKLVRWSNKLNGMVH